jgi:hypothetical protein
LSRRDVLGLRWCFSTTAVVTMMTVKRLMGIETGSIGLRAWHAVGVLSSPSRSPALPEISCRRAKGPQLAGMCATVRFQRRRSYSLEAVSAHFSLAPKSRFPETETASGGDPVRMPVTPRPVRASGAGATIRRACRRAVPLPCHEGAVHRWPPSRDPAPGRQARSSC